VNGTLDITVSGSGNITGSVVNLTDNESGAVSGRIGDNGGISCYYDYRWTHYKAIGGLSTNASADRLVGTITEYDVFNIPIRQDSIDLIKQ
jgi:hypothetical protein